MAATPRGPFLLLQKELTAGMFHGEGYSRQDIVKYPAVLKFSPLHKTAAPGPVGLQEDKLKLTSWFKQAFFVLICQAFLRQFAQVVR